jgi:Flp pilus assembly protein TadG
MRHLRNQKGNRRGSIVVLAALLMIMLVGMLAFAIDIGYMSTVKAELQNAADAAALAGAQY